VVLVRGDAEVASWPLTGDDAADMSTVDALARLQLCAGRIGCTLWVRDAGDRLRELVDLAGLAGVVVTPGETRPQA